MALNWLRSIFGTSTAPEPDPYRGRVLEVRNLARWGDIVGCWEAVEKLKDVRRNLSEFPSRRFFTAFLPSGVLIAGPDGCGKRLLIRALAGEAGVKLLTIDLHNLPLTEDASLSKMIETLAKEARTMHRAVLIHFENIESIIGPLPSEPQARDRYLARERAFQNVAETSSLNGIMVAVTMRDPKTLKSMVLGRLKRDGRVVIVPELDARARYEMFERCLKSVPSYVRSAQLAEDTEGLTGGSIENICRRAGDFAARRYSEESKLVPYRLIESDFEEAIRDEKRRLDFMTNIAESAPKGKGGGECSDQ